MRIWLDTEFNGFNGELLSIGMCGEDGSSFYYVLPFHPFDLCEWVGENVAPQIFVDPDSMDMQEGMVSAEKEVIQSLLSRYLCQYYTVEIIADWPEDIKHFCELLIIGPGVMVDTPLKMTYTVNRALCGESKLPHHAYFDALGNMEQQLRVEEEYRKFIEKREELHIID